MSNTNITKEQEQASIAFVDRLFTHVSGRAHVRLNGDLAGFDAVRKKVYIDSYTEKTVSMPAGAFLSHLAREEIAELDVLEDWDGSNEYKLSTAVLLAAKRAIRRYHGGLVKDEDGQPCFEMVADGVVSRSYNVDQ
ncbi:hypothetical protein [Sulfurisoma sediminicola]|uniref:Uncharacterized protein n=1 Tax=Sulfurisoma sediminicola TaxID=1381557 RepID=A0A497XDH5_9PROT|nr:hypothetical protein [Sulfurisoma sediminicola]RLJ64605.1 hypothetical protein DFR35_1246 [Sulfurisoma sediminicola]